MIRASSPALVPAVTGVALLAAATTPVFNQNAFTGVSISVSRETAPPGGMAQVKVFVTEPKPITTGGGAYTFDAYESVDGIALINEAEDVAGFALVRGTTVTLSFVSPSGTFGLDADYPILAVAGRIPPDAPVGTKYPLVFDVTALQLYDPAGVLYPVEAKAGHLITAPGVSIHDVIPGSAVVPAGGLVTILGSGFEPATEIRFKESKLSRVIYRSPQQIDVTVKDTIRMHGTEIKASNRDGSRSTYFSYQRTRADVASADPVLRYAVPLLPPAGGTSATVRFPAPALLHTYGVAVQNIDADVAAVAFELIDAGGVRLASATRALPRDRFIVLELTELFDAAPGGSCSVRVTSATPVQVLGVSADQGSGTAAPIRPE